MNKCSVWCMLIWLFSLPSLSRTQVFDNPTVDGFPLDNCVHKASGCGQTAANAFCKSQGFAEATDDWVLNRQRGRVTTKTIGGDVCPPEFGCDYFTHLTCASASRARTDDVSGGAQVHMSALEEDINRYGMDYNNALVEPGGTAEECRQRCFREEKCRSFSWVKPHIQGNEARCWLKSGVPGTSHNTDCISGVKIYDSTGSPTSPAAPAGRIQVISAVYGANCGHPSNVGADLGGACNGKQRCDYLVDHRRIGDPAIGCRKEYVYRWQCNGSEKYRPSKSRAYQGRHLENRRRYGAGDNTGTRGKSHGKA